VAKTSVMFRGPWKKETKMGTSNTGFIQEIIGWFKQPFDSQGSALNWALFVGLLIVIVWMWNIILMKLANDL